jgi:hypothetical protein
MADLDVFDTATGKRDQVEGTNGGLKVRPVSGTGRVSHNRQINVASDSTLIEVKFPLTSNITEVTITSSAADLGVIFDSFDNSSLGTSGNMPNDPDTDVPFFFVLQNQTQKFSFSEPLSYNGNAGFKGNIWFRCTGAGDWHVAAS